MSYISSVTKLIPNIELKEAVENPNSFKKKLESIVSAHFYEEEYIENSFGSFKAVLNSLSMLYRAVPAGYHTQIKLELKSDSEIIFNLKDADSRINFSEGFVHDEDVKVLVYDKNKDFGSNINIDDYEDKKRKYDSVMPLYDADIGALQSLIAFHTGTSEGKANSPKKSIDYLLESIGNDIVKNSKHKEEAMKNVDSIFETILSQIKQDNEKKTVLEFENLKAAFLNEYSRFVHDFPHVTFFIEIEYKGKQYRQDFFGYMPNEFKIELVKNTFFDA